MKISNTPAANSEAQAFRPEIQGLRAVAVLAVLIFHIWPSALPGGYVGVDVFFVISGFLITSLLLREAEETGDVSIAAFYERRIRRLLPAATLVLVTVGLCIDLLPEVRWSETAFGIGASALYVQNWWLADRAVTIAALAVAGVFAKETVALIVSAPALAVVFWNDRASRWRWIVPAALA